MDLISQNWNDFVLQPISTVNRMFEQFQKHSSIAATSKEGGKQILEFHENLKQQVLKCTQDPDKLNSIPFLNGRVNIHDALPNRSLVRYQCMVQDMFNPEVYTAAIRATSPADDNRIGTSRRLTLYADFNLNEEEVNAYDSSNVILDRYVYYAISVPGVNSWVQQRWTEMTVCSNLFRCESTTSPDKSTVKRSADYNENGGDLTVPDLANKSSETGHQSFANKESASKRKRVSFDPASSKNEDSKGESVFDSCSPIESDKLTNRPCIVKVYDDEDTLVKLNDVIEVIGIIEFEETNNLKTQASADKDEATLSEDLQEMLKNLELESEDYFNYPYSLVPRLHALTVTPVQQLNPLPTYQLPDDLTKVDRLKVELHSILTQVLFGDTLAAEYFICWLISSVYSRKDVLAIGNFPLNLSRIPTSSDSTASTFVTKLYELVQRLCSHSHLLPLSIRSLNETVLTPSQSKNGSKLRSGLLQLPSNLMLIIDETALEAGQLRELGLRNLNALKELISWQSVEYRQLMYTYKMNTNVNVLVISEGKSLLEVPCQLPIKAASTADVPSSFAAVDQYLVDSLLDSIRRYISSLRDVKYEISPQVQERIQTDFVKMRQQSNRPGAPKISSDDLHLFLNFARLLILSTGQTVLTLDFWEKTVQFENERRTRILSKN